MKPTRSVVKPEQYQTYFLIAGEVVFQVSEEAQLSAVRLNTVVMSTESRFSLHQIARAQQAIQIQFHKQAGDNTAKILNVVILGIMQLGLFTAEEFNARPEGLQVQEVSLVQ